MVFVIMIKGSGPFFKQIESFVKLATVLNSLTQLLWVVLQLAKDGFGTTEEEMEA